MTQPECHEARESWSFYRSAFNRRSRAFPALAVLVQIIDWIVEQGYAEQLYASASLDHLVISVQPKPRDRRRTVLVIPKGEAVEFRFYPEAGAEELCTAPPDQVESVLERFLRRLTASRNGPSNDAENGESEG